MGKIKEALLHRDGKLYQMQRARNIARTLGSRSAAGYLRARGWTVEAAAYIIGTAGNVRITYH